MRRLLQTLLIVCLPFAIWAQDFLTQYRGVTVTDGLPGSSINQVLQDKKGFIWIATFNGIARFDGHEIKTYHPAFQSDSLTAPRDYPTLHESAYGKLWLGYILAKNKVFQYDYSQDTFLLLDLAPLAKDPSIGIRAIWQDTTQQLWLATGDRGLWSFDLANQTDTIPYQVFQYQAEVPTSLPTNYMASGIWRDASGQLWILTESGLSCLPAGEMTFTNYTWSDIPIANEGLSFWPDEQRRCFWIGTFFGLVQFNWDDQRTQRFQLFSADNQQEALLIGSPVVDDQSSRRKLIRHLYLRIPQRWRD